MSVNSSSNSSLQTCDNFRIGLPVFIPLFVSSILLLPLFILVLFVGYQQWRKQSSTTSHSDIFTFNMVALELISILGSCFFCCGAYTNEQFVMIVGMCMFSIISPGQTLFHNLTCVERYLAVVHPITYRGLRQAGGVRIRNISVVCVWLLCFMSMGLSFISPHFSIALNALFFLFSCIVVSFCSLSVLCFLIRPRPGEVGGNRERIDQSKKRAFHTIMAITLALFFRLLSNVISTVLYIVLGLNSCDIFLTVWSLGWLSIPSSLVLPLLFLHRAGKLPGCKRNTG